MLSEDPVLPLLGEKFGGGAHLVAGACSLRGAKARRGTTGLHGRAGATGEVELGMEPGERLAAGGGEPGFKQAGSMGMSPFSSHLELCRAVDPFMMARESLDQVLQSPCLPDADAPSEQTRTLRP